MADNKLTPWFLTPHGGMIYGRAGHNPVRKGFYVATCSTNHFYRYWNGKWWSRGGFEMADAVKFAQLKYTGNVVRWRGLTKEPTHG